MPGILKDGRFWIGLLAGYLLVTFIPSLSVKRITGKATGSS